MGVQGCMVYRVLVYRVHVSVPPWYMSQCHRGTCLSVTVVPWPMSQCLSGPVANVSVSQCHRGHGLSVTVVMVSVSPWTRDPWTRDPWTTVPVPVNHCPCTRITVYYRVLQCTRVWPKVGFVNSWWFSKKTEYFMKILNSWWFLENWIFHEIHDFSCFCEYSCGQNVTVSLIVLWFEGKKRRCLTSLAQMYKIHRKHRIYWHFGTFRTF